MLKKETQGLQMWRKLKAIHFLKIKIKSMLYTLDIPNFWQIYTEKPFHMKGFKPKHHKAILQKFN